MDEESLFRDIHKRLVRQAKDGGKVDTEVQLADHFHVSRYKIRRVLDQLASLGVIDRTQKKGVTLNEPRPEALSANIGMYVTVSGFDIHETIEARETTELELLDLVLKRITPVHLGRLEQCVSRMEGCTDYHAAVLRMHMELHRLFIEGNGNRILFGYADSLLLVTSNFFDSDGHYDHDMVTDLVLYDRAFVQALREQNRVNARQALMKSLHTEGLLVAEANRRSVLAEMQEAKRS